MACVSLVQVTQTTEAPHTTPVAVVMKSVDLSLASATGTAPTDVSHLAQSIRYMSYHPSATHVHTYTYRHRKLLELHIRGDTLARTYTHTHTHTHGRSRTHTHTHTHTQDGAAGRARERERERESVCVCALFALSSAQGEQKLSFGAGFFGAQPADDCYAPTQRLPDLSLLPFVERYADADVCSVLSACCRAGRELVRRTARKEQLRVQLGCSDDTWKEQLATLQQAVEVRYVQPAQITVVCECGTTELCVARAAELVGLLQGTGHTIRTLDVNADKHDNDVSGLLSRIAPVLPALARLVVQGHHSEELIVLPPPGTWPYLRSAKLEIGNPIHRKSHMPFPLIAPYMAQITFLELGDHTHDAEWHNLFPFSSPTHTLTHLALPWMTLRGSLVSLLLTHAPSVKQLTVWEIGEGIPAGFSEHVWGLEEIWLTQESDLYLELEDISCLASLARPRTGRVDLGYRVGQDAKPRQLLFTITSTEVSTHTHTHTHAHTHMSRCEPMHRMSHTCGCCQHAEVVRATMLPCWPFHDCSLFAPSGCLAMPGLRVCAGYQEWG